MNYQLLFLIALAAPMGVFAMGKPTKTYLEFTKQYSRKTVTPEQVQESYENIANNPHEQETKIYLDKFIVNYNESHNHYLEAILKTKKIDLNALIFESNTTALMLAALAKHTGKIALLLKFGADIEMQDTKGQTAFHYLNTHSDLHEHKAKIGQIQKMLERAQEKAVINKISKKREKKIALEKQKIALESQRIINYQHNNPLLFTHITLLANLRK